jgi:transposase
MRQQRQKIPDGSATARAIDYIQPQPLGGADALPGRWRSADRQQLGGKPHRPIALGRQNWLFADSLWAGKRAAAIMSLIHSAKLNGLDPYDCMRDVLERLPMQPAGRIAELLPHHWQPTTSA